MGDAATAAAADVFADDGVVATDPAVATPAEEVESLKAQLADLCAKMKKKRPTKAERAVIAMTRRELKAAVNAPVSGGRNTTESLPDELILTIMLMLPFVALWSGACECVCRRWERLMESAPIVRRKREGRWAAYESGVLKPQRLSGHTDAVWALTLGPNGKIYSGSDDMTIRVWSGESGAHLQTLQGHTNWVSALTVGLDGKIYSGSDDKTIRVWSSASGAHLQTLVGHSGHVWALAVGLDGKVYSGSNDSAVRVWSGDDGTHLQTLVGHTNAVMALAVGKDGAIYSGSSDCTIRVWSGEDGTHLRTLVGHTDSVFSLAVGLDGKVYSGSRDTTVRVWSPGDGALLQNLEGHTHRVRTLAVGPDGKVLSGSDDGTLRVWSGDTGALLHSLYNANAVWSLAVCENTLYLGHIDNMIRVWR
jgi:WD40 repeat protein